MKLPKSYYQAKSNLGASRTGAFLCLGIPKEKMDAGLAAMSTDWFWEGNIVDTLEKQLTDSGWSIVSKADTATRQAGIDLHATKRDVELLIEAKGYPSTMYQRGAKQGMPKPTNPSTQARHWYAAALLCSMLRQHERPNAIVAIALPEFPVFLGLIKRTERSLHKLGLRVLILSETGAVQVIGDPI